MLKFRPNSVIELLAGCADHGDANEMEREQIDQAKELRRRLTSQELALAQRALQEIRRLTTFEELKQRRLAAPNDHSLSDLKSRPLPFATGISGSKDFEQNRQFHEALADCLTVITLLGRLFLGPLQSGWTVSILLASAFVGTDFSSAQWVSTGWRPSDGDDGPTNVARTESLNDAASQRSELQRRCKASGSEVLRKLGFTSNEMVREWDCSKQQTMDPHCDINCARVGGMPSCAAIISRGEPKPSSPDTKGFDLCDGALAVGGSAKQGGTNPMRSAFEFMQAARRGTHHIHWRKPSKRGTITWLWALTQFHCPRSASWRDVLILYLTFSVFVILELLVTHLPFVKEVNERTLLMHLLKCVVVDRTTDLPKLRRLGLVPPSNSPHSGETRYNVHRDLKLIPPSQRAESQTILRLPIPTDEKVVRLFAPRLLAVVPLTIVRSVAGFLASHGRLDLEVAREAFPCDQDLLFDKRVCNSLTHTDTKNGVFYSIVRMVVAKHPARKDHVWIILAWLHVVYITSSKAACELKLVPASMGDIAQGFIQGDLDAMLECCRWLHKINYNLDAARGKGTIAFKITTKRHQVGVYYLHSNVRHVDAGSATEDLDPLEYEYDSDEEPKNDEEPKKEAKQRATPSLAGDEGMGGKNSLLAALHRNKERLARCSTCKEILEELGSQVPIDEGGGPRYPGAGGLITARILELTETTMLFTGALDMWTDIDRGSKKPFALAAAELGIDMSDIEPCVVLQSLSRWLSAYDKDGKRRLVRAISELAHKIPGLTGISNEVGLVADTEMSGGTSEVLLCDALYRAYRWLFLHAPNPKPKRWDAEVSLGYSPMDCVPSWQDSLSERPSVHNVGQFLLALHKFTCGVCQEASIRKQRPQLSDKEFCVAAIFSEGGTDSAVICDSRLAAPEKAEDMDMSSAVHMSTWSTKLDGHKEDGHKGEAPQAHKASRRVAFDAPVRASKRTAQGRTPQEEGAAACRLNEALYASLGLPPMGSYANPAQFTSLLWLNTTDDLELHARVIDYWQRGHTESGALAHYLRRLGFVVETEPVKCWQRGVSCGIVAADTVTSMRLAEQRQAGGWLEADTTGATDINVIMDANGCQEEWARPEDCFSAHRLRRDPALTRYLTTDEVHLLAGLSWSRVRAPPAGEEQGPPCARCDKADHKSSECPHFPRCRGGRNDSESLTVGALDSVYAQIARELHAITTVGPDSDAAGFQRRTVWPKYFISNNKKGGVGSGEHWFTVAYSIRRRR